MKRVLAAGLVLIFATASSLTAKEPPQPDHPVRWTLDRNVKDLFEPEIAQFEKQLKEKLGPQKLKASPFVVDEKYKDDPRAAALEAITLEQILDGHLRGMRKWADHDNQVFLPGYFALRRPSVDAGSDLEGTPVLSPRHPKCGNLSGNVTFVLEWEQTAGEFTSEWNHNDVDETYEVELQATLTLGVEVLIHNDEKRTMTLVSHSVTKPLVRDWRVKLLASEGVPQDVTPVNRSDSPDKASPEE